MFISEAYAQAAGGGGGGGGGMMQILMIVLIFVVFYFLLIRPQQKRAKDHRLMVANVKRNDIVVTGGGIVGKVTKAGEGSEIEVEIAPEVKVKVERSTLMAVRPKGTPAAAAARPGDPANEPRQSVIKRLFGGR
jgi:preprotein translocase subunit YajC